MEVHICPHALLKLPHSALTIAEARRHSKLGVSLRSVALRHQRLDLQTDLALAGSKELTSRSTNLVHSGTAQVEPSDQVKSTVGRGRGRGPGPS